MLSIEIDEDLLIRTYTPDDAAELFSAIDGSRKHLQPWLNWVGSTTKPEHSLQFIQNSLEQLRMQEGLALGIFYKGSIAGGIGMHEWDQNTRRAQVGYWLAQGHEGKGLVHRSLNKFAAHLFEKIGLNKIEVRFAPANKRSARVAERLGCQVEGVIRQCIMRNGVQDDVVVAGILKHEWKAKQNQPG